RAPAMNPLQFRLAGLRRRLRTVVTFRGLCWLAALLLASVTLAGLIDWRIHLPSLVRAFLLVGTLVGAAVVVYRYLVRPWSARSDDLSLALQVESKYGYLNDALASAVQFLEQPGDSHGSSSPSLRQAAVERALNKVLHLDFRSIVDTRGTRLSCVSLIA